MKREHEMAHKNELEKPAQNRLPFFSGFGCGCVAFKQLACYLWTISVAWHAGGQGRQRRRQRKKLNRFPIVVRIPI